MKDPIVATLTCTASFGASLDLQRVWRECVVGREGVKAIRNASATQCRPHGALPTGRPFGRQVTMLVGVDSGRLCNVKLFGNGSAQITGAGSRADAVEAARVVSDAIGLGTTADDVRVRLIVAHLRCLPAVERTRLVKTIEALGTGVQAAFDPSVKPVAKVVFCFNTCDSRLLASHDGVCRCSTQCAYAPARNRRCLKCVALIHRTGTVTLMGACSNSHVDRAAAIIQGFVRATERSHDEGDRDRDEGDGSAQFTADPGKRRHRERRHD